MLPGTTDQGSGLDRGNPTQVADSGQEGAGTFLTGLDKEAGSGTQAASQQGTQDDQSSQSKGSEPPTGILPGYLAGLTKELKADPKVAQFGGKFKTMDDLVRSAIEADSKLGSMVKIPTDDAPPEEVQAFYKKLGVPEKPEDYKLSAKDLTEEQLQEIKKTAFKFHLSQKDAQEFAAETARSLNVVVDSYKAKMVQAAQDTEKALKSEWGEKYSQNHNVMVRGWRAFGSKELAAELDQSGLGNSVHMAKLLYRLGQLVQEDTTSHGGVKTGSVSRDTGVERPGL